MNVRDFLLRKRVRNGKQIWRHLTILKPLFQSVLKYSLYIAFVATYITRRRIIVRSARYYRRATRYTRFLIRTNFCKYG